MELRAYPGYCWAYTLDRSPVLRRATQSLPHSLSFATSINPRAKYWWWLEHRSREENRGRRAGEPSWMQRETTIHEPKDKIWLCLAQKKGGLLSHWFKVMMVCRVTLQPSVPVNGVVIPYWNCAKASPSSFKKQETSPFSLNKRATSPICRTCLWSIFHVNFKECIFEIGLWVNLTIRIKKKLYSAGSK